MDGFRRYFVVGHVIDIHAREGSGPDVQYDFCSLDSRRVNRAEELVGEVKAGGRRGDAPRLPRVDRLVSLVIERRVRAIDVGGKRKMADSPECLDDVAPANDLHGSRAIGVNRDNPNFGLCVEGNFRVEAQATTGPDKRAKLLGFLRLGKEVENFRFAAATQSAEQPGGKHSAAIHDDQIARSKELRQLIES